MLNKKFNLNFQHLKTMYNRVALHVKQLQYIIIKSLMTITKNVILTEVMNFSVKLHVVPKLLG